MPDCPYCGNDVSWNAAFCPKCGERDLYRSMWKEQESQESSSKKVETGMAMAGLSFLCLWLCPPFNLIFAFIAIDQGKKALRLEGLSDEDYRSANQATKVAWLTVGITVVFFVGVIAFGLYNNYAR